MSKKDFQLIAETLRARGAQHPIAVATIARDFADALRVTNSRFDRARFLAACGVSE